MEGSDQVSESRQEVYIRIEDTKSLGNNATDIGTIRGKESTSELSMEEDKILNFVVKYKSRTKFNAFIKVI